jgi:superkiller protein 3
VNNNEQEEAMMHAETAARDNPTNPDLHVELGKLYFHANRLDEAMAAFHQAVALNPNSAPAFNWIGRIFENKGQAEEAIKAFQRSIDLDPKSPDAYFGMGIVNYDQLADYEAAVDAIQKGMEHNPDLGYLVAILGNVYSRMGQFEEAIATWQKAVQLQPELAFAYSGMSEAYLYLKRYDDVIAACQREIEIEDGNDARRVLGYAYHFQGRYEMAIDQFERSMALEPQDYEARAALAGVYRAVGRRQDADEQYALASEMASQDNEYGQACFEAVSGNIELALTLLADGLAKGQVKPGWARMDPEFAGINDDPRFIALVEG